MNRTRLWSVLVATTFTLCACATPETGSRGSSRVLAVDVAPDGVFCDGTERRAAVLYGANPRERLIFSSPMPIEIADGVTDDDGRYRFEWACADDEAGLTWTITAVGQTSAQEVTFDIRGSYDDPQVDEMLVFEAAVDPLTCDDTGQTVGRLGNAAPSEIVDFTSPDAQRLSPGVADGDGGLDVNWRCAHDQAGTAWTVTAEGRESGRTTTFALEGVAAQPLQDGGIVVDVIENPFVCDGSRRPVAELTNLTPNIEVEFEATPNDDAIRPGEANAEGALTVFWQCGPRDGGTSWQLTARERPTTGRSITMTIEAVASSVPEVTLAVIEDPFRCDGTSHQYGLLTNLIPGEYVDFTSPQSNSIRQGQAGPDGALVVRWQCEADDVGLTWEVTARGQTSGGSVTFEIRGGE